MRRILILLLLFIASPAFCDPSEWCIKAINAGNKEAADRYAKILLRTYTPTDKSRIKDGVECLKQYNGKHYIYYQKLKRFLTEEEYETARREVEVAARQVEERAKKEEADRQERERVLEEFRRKTEEQKLIRERAVLSALAEACTDKFGRDRYSAITNRLCFDYFMANGLPE